MKLKRANLQAALNASCVDNGLVMPILSCIRITGRKEKKRESVLIEATDLDSRSVIMIPAAGVSDGEVFLLFIKELKKALTLAKEYEWAELIKVADDPWGAEVKFSNSGMLVSGRWVRIGGLNPEEFPKFSILTADANLYPGLGVALRRMLKLWDGTEAPFENGANLHLAGDRIEYTNGHYAVVLDAVCPTAKLLMKSLRNIPEGIDRAMQDEQHLYLMGQGTYYALRLSDHELPDLASVTPKQTPWSIDVSRDDLLWLVRNAGERDQLVFNLLAKRMECGKNQIAYPRWGDFEFQFALNPVYVKLLFRNWGEQVRIEWAKKNNEMLPFIIQQAPIKILIMPCRL